MGELSKDGAEESDNSSGSGGSVLPARSKRGVGGGGEGGIAWRSSLKRRVQRAKSHGHRSRGVHGDRSEVGKAAENS